MGESQDSSSIAHRMKDHIGWWLAAVAAVASTVALLLSMTWPGEWRDNANSVCDRLPKVWTAMHAANDAVQALNYKRKHRLTISDSEWQEASRKWEEAGNELSEFIGDLRGVDKPWWGGMGDQIDTAMDHGSAAARSLNQTGRALAARNESTATHYINTYNSHLAEWTEIMQALKVDQCVSAEHE
jgi:hypothetical protein